MGRITFADTVAVPVDQVFDYLTDPDNASQVLRGVKELRMLTSGALRHGTRLLATRGKFDEEFVVSVCNPPNAYRLEGGIPRLTTKIGYQLETSGSKTHVAMTFDWQLHGILRVIEPLFRRRMRKEQGQTFASLILKVASA